MYQHKNFVKQVGTSHWNKLELTYLPPARMKVSQLMPTRPYMQEARERFKKISEGHFVWCVVFLQCSEMKVTVFRSSNLSSESTNITIQVLISSPCWSKKQDAGMETSHAKRIFSDNVTCFGTNKSCSNRSHLSGCFKCSSLLSCKAPRVQLGTAFNLCSNCIHLTASLYLCPADCFQDILLEQAGNSHWNKLAFLHISSDISAPWAHESKSLDVNAAKHARNLRKVQEDKLT